MERFRPHVWWVIPTLGVAAGLGALFGYPLAWLGYGAFNIAGVWLYCGSGRPLRKQFWMKSLAIVMAPVGVIGAMSSSGSGLTPTQAATVGSEDESTRSESIRSAGLFNRGSL